MARRTVDLELSCPPRVTEGDDLLADIRVTGSGPFDVVDARVQWVTRLTVHQRVWTYKPAHYAVGWSQVSRVHREDVAASARVAPLLGSHPGGPAVEARVRLEAVGVPASTVMLPGFGDVSHYVDATVRTADGSEVTERTRLFVRPHPPRSSDVVPGPVAPEGGPAIGLGSGTGGPLYGEFYRPVEGVATLRSGPDGMAAGRLRATLVCSALWTVHYLKPIRPDGPADWLHRRELRQETIERETAERSMSLGTLSVPAVPPGSAVELPFSWPGPKGTAQTTETAEGSITWRIEARWEAGGAPVEGSFPIVMSLPPAQDRPLRGGPARWLRTLRGRPADEAGAGR